MTEPEVSPIVEGVRQFVRREIMPHVARFEEQDEFPQHVVDAMAALGLFGMVVPEAYGGLDLPLEDYVAIMEELGAGWSAMPSFLNSHCTVARLIALYGTQAQKEHYLPQILSMLEAGRLAMAGTAIGMARHALSVALQYSKDRETFGQPICNHQAVQTHLANMATQLVASRAIVSEALRHKARYGRADMMASMAKLFVTEATMQITQDAMRVLGGYGYVAEFPIERLYREAPIYVLTEGSNEIQRIIIAREMIKADGPERLGLI